MGKYNIVLQIVVSVFLLEVFTKDSVVVCVDAGKGHRARLTRDLLKGYDKDARPVKNDSVTVVKIALYYIQLQDLDEPTQVARSLMWINMYWKDEYLTWNASEYGGLTEIHLKVSRIWVPDMTLYNNAKKHGAKMIDVSFNAVVKHDGNISLGSPLLIHSVCPINIERFPFDTQSCTIKIGSWSYTGFDLDLRLEESTKGISTKSLKANSVWELISTSASRNSVKYECCPAQYIDLTYILEFRRKPLYYIMTIIFPSVLLSFLSCISFLFPAGSGERVSLVISVLLGLVVFMLIVNERTPVTSDATPMLTQFFNSIGASTVLALIATAFILRLNHAPTAQAVPRYLAYVRDCVAVPLCMRREALKRVDLYLEDIQLANSQVTKNGSERENGSPNMRAGLIELRRKLNEENILIELQKITARLRDENLVNELKEDWHYTMRVFDRFFFVIFFLIFIVFVAYIFSL